MEHFTRQLARSALMRLTRSVHVLRDILTNTWILVWAFTGSSPFWLLAAETATFVTAFILAVLVYHRLRANVWMISTWAEKLLRLTVPLSALALVLLSDTLWHRLASLSLLITSVTAVSIDWWLGLRRKRQHGI